MNKNKCHIHFEIKIFFKSDNNLILHELKKQDVTYQTQS